MSLSGIILGLINVAIVVIILLLVGAVAHWILRNLGWGLPTEVERLYIGLVALIALYLIVALLFGLPAVHILRGTGPVSVPAIAAVPPIIAPEPR